MPRFMVKLAYRYEIESANLVEAQREALADFRKHLEGPVNVESVHEMAGEISPEEEAAKAEYYRDSGAFGNPDR